MQEEARLPTHLRVGAAMRHAAAEGIAITVVRRGESQSGTIVLKINRLDGTAHVLVQVRHGARLGWSPASRHDPLPETEAETLLHRQGAVDPDAWLLEIDDRLGRHWFDEPRF